ncbi:UDP-glucose/GDP-mannose dehydrogenase family protein [Paenibacillus sp. GD4]|jgi:UDPglucose 6-dehydrogenase|uniref:UDP-glucose dehydrogenase family protein n=1 Tax=Paenibacillus sp. GD4 TaxID=3068890 RepID=UPI0027966655|nr:UDP-glucose/GDP-mannose dehydrogenase family protein [Paenibacillus sp. GD4]MDQ1910408.1 UDP-glucose/GDP-mannose dehydrogenase family protein [Paenibacillus sp. GD4]
MKVTVIGTGYVGLTTGITLGFLGHEVTCVDVDENKINRLQGGSLPIHEPLLDQLLTAARENMAFTTSYEEAVREADVIFFAVGTPANEDGSPNLSYLFCALDDTIRFITEKETPTVLVNKSTVPVGTGDQMQEQIRSAGLEGRVTVVSNPEFLRQGRAVKDTLYPDRIVVGGDEHGVRTLRQLYFPILDQSFLAPKGAPRPQSFAGVAFLTVDRRSAELAKYAANAFLAMKVSFINEIANVCDGVGASVEHVADIIGTDPRIGAAFLQAGIGYGGSCFPKDTQALQYIAGTSGYDFKLLSSVIEVNNEQKFRMLHKLQEELNDLRGRKITVLGLTFKPGTDDLREAPSLPIIARLLELGAEVHAHDPIAVEKARQALPMEVQLHEDLYEALYQAEGALLVTEWPVYAKLKAAFLLSAMKNPLLIDGRNALAEEERQLLDYRGIGLGEQAVRRWQHELV